MNSSYNTDRHNNIISQLDGIHRRCLVTFTWHETVLLKRRRSELVIRVSPLTGMIRDCRTALVLYRTTEAINKCHDSIPPLFPALLGAVKVNITPQPWDSWVHLAQQMRPTVGWRAVCVWDREREPEQPVLTCPAILVTCHKQSLLHSPTAASLLYLSQAAWGGASLTPGVVGMNPSESSDYWIHL